MIFSHKSSAVQPERNVLLRMVACCCFFFVLTAGRAGAGYGPEVLRVHEGGGTWGDILEMSAVVQDSSIVFTVRKKNRLPFHTESDITIRTGSRNGPAAVSGVVPIDSSSVSLSLRQDRLGTDQSYYAYLFNSYGHAWVGPLKFFGSDSVGDNENAFTRVRTGMPERRVDGPTRPRIENLPAAVPVNQRVLIGVRVGACPDGGKVRLQCFAEDEEGRSNQYESAPVWSDSLVRVPFRFDQPGQQNIFCATTSRCCSSPWVSSTVKVQKSPPALGGARSETKINISVVTDAEGRADSKVSVQNSRTTACAPFCDGEISYDRPYLPEESSVMPYYDDTPPDGSRVQQDIIQDTL